MLKVADALLIVLLEVELKMAMLMPPCVLPGLAIMFETDVVPRRPVLTLPIARLDVKGTRAVVVRAVVLPYYRLDRSSAVSQQLLNRIPQAFGARCERAQSLLPVALVLLQQL